jgi:hypothetical protein
MTPASRPSLRHPSGLADTPNSNESDQGLVHDTTTVLQYYIMLRIVTLESGLHRGESSWDSLSAYHRMCQMLDFVRDLDLVSGPRYIRF